MSSNEDRTFQAKIKRANCNKIEPMTARQIRYSKEEFAQRGDEIYEFQVRLLPVGYAKIDWE
ncbi:hypothetical protein C7B77_01870 [Chamaesiphon polymorphus CCALA 037]|uniref:Uncharacterized protein n=1 Tax=Chamaesiphon polymorphus CCALA 037 TaxID=2107692 RepID=A0A2T1GMN1_9CYAN|nr:hypothetical protein C7B77_01870 [Chamaesiphon polymorphus CCALA 037]